MRLLAGRWGGGFLLLPAALVLTSSLFRVQYQYYRAVTRSPCIGTVFELSSLLAVGGKEGLSDLDVRAQLLRLAQ
jgi:hypothetical protein